MPKKEKTKAERLKALDESIEWAKEHNRRLASRLRRLKKKVEAEPD